ncbi:MAG: CopG family antitoxin [Anaerolineae bacterium]
MAKIPEFKSYEEEAEFWATHDSTDYLDDMEPVEIEIDPNVKSPRDLSPCCPVCDEVLLSRYVDVEVAGGRATLHGLRELYCQEGHITRLAPEAEEMVRLLKIINKLIEEKEVFKKINKAKMIEFLSNMVENLSFEQLTSVTDDELTNRIEKIMLIEASSGILNELSQAQMESFEEAIKRREFFG